MRSRDVGTSMSRAVPLPIRGSVCSPRRASARTILNETATPRGRSKAARSSP
jgi:hypothetical protein